MNITDLNGNTMAPVSNAPIDMKRELKALECIDPVKMKPTGCRILLRVADVDSISPGGIIRADSDVVKEIFGSTFATLVKASDASFIDPITGDKFADAPQEGDEVLTTKYPGNAYRDEEGNIYRFANDMDVVSVIGDRK